MHASAPATARRKDIEGLRAIGMSLVVICHIWVGKVSGGVDVFFVISAYLMTGSLLGKVEKGGHIDPLAFWGRIILRICPTAFVILLLTLLAGIFFEPISLWRSFALHGWMALLQLENLQLLRESTDYLARSDPASPFQQYWALSTQMQFYGFLPLWLLLVTGLGRMVGGHDDVRRAIAAACAVLGLASFVFALWILARNPAPHYFNPAARLWEFMAGCLCACVPMAWRFQGSAAALIRGAGLLLILLCVWIVPADAPYPGLAALWPVSGAVLILLCGAGDTGFSPARMLLEAPLLQRLARLSFAFYLAHWPILVFAQEILGTTRLDLLQGLLVIALALLVAAIVQRSVETPGKALGDHWSKARGPWHGRLSAFAAGAMLAAPAAAFLAGWQMHFGAIARDYAATFKVKPITGPIEQLDEGLPPDIDRQLIAAKGMLPEPYSNGCDTGPHSSEVRVCTVGNPDPAAFTILLIGGSHSTQWYPALKLIAQDRGWRLLSITKSACPIDGTYIGPPTAGDQVEACRSWAREALAKAVALKPDIVVTTATRPGPRNVGEVVPEGFVRAWNVLTAHGSRVLAIRDNPRPETYSIPECIDRSRRTPQTCNMRRSEHFSPDVWRKGIAQSRSISFWDIADLVCSSHSCPAVRSGMLVYNDNSHMSVPLVIALTPIMKRQIKSATTLSGA